MHGRVKTISTEEQKVKQKKERAVKVQIYKDRMEKISLKRTQNEYDDEALNLTRELLVGNPDIITLWNYRREVFIFMKANLESTEFDNTLKADLTLTEICLRVNPKSYGTWQHRIWLLDNVNEKMWLQEIDLCNKYLGLDERNFHCWQYRNIVAEKAKIPALKEYEFTTEKIEKNFSNYSAWHYRSKLLPQIFQDSKGMFPIAEDKHKAELELVQNAAFTDPDDQSAWFYLRWLLDLRRPAIKIISAFTCLNDLVIAFSREIPPETNVRIQSDGNGTATCNSKTSALWKFTFETPLSLDARIEIAINATDDFEAVDNLTITGSQSYTTRPTFTPSYSSALIEAFEDQLRNCEELLTLEPNSKWTLLTSVLAMKSINVLSYQDKIVSALQQLIQVDRLRAGYYNDLRTQIEIEIELLKNPFSESFVLQNKSLTCLYHLQYLCLSKNVDLSHNNLKDNHLTSMHYLLSCKSLDLSHNQIKSIVTLPILSELEFLNVSNNPITDANSDKAYLNKFPNLKKITF